MLLFFFFVCLFILSLCCGLWVCLVWVCWLVFCFKGGGAGPTSRTNYLSPVHSQGVSLRPVPTQDPRPHPGQPGGSSRSHPAAHGPSAVPMLQLVGAALSLCHLYPGRPCTSGPLLEVLGVSRVCPVSSLVRGRTPAVPVPQLCCLSAPLPTLLRQLLPAVCGSHALSANIFHEEQNCLGE